MAQLALFALACLALPLLAGYFFGGAAVLALWVLCFGFLAYQAGGVRPVEGYCGLCDKDLPAGNLCSECREVVDG